MRVYSMHHDIKVEQVLDIAAITSNTATNTSIVDTAGFEALEFLFSSSTVTDGTYVVSLQHGDDASLSDATTVSSDETLGAFTYVAADDNVAKRVGYIGKRRYVRAVLTSTGVATGGTFGAVSILGTPHHAPVADD